MDQQGHSGHGSAEGLRGDIAANLGRICALLHRSTGHDFSRYKESTLLRRIQRHLEIRRSTSVGGYLRDLEQDPPEAESLFKDLLIGVTCFFRDAEIFDLLGRQVIPRLFGNKAPDAAVRIWVPGCASGEEVYSIAILVREHLTASNLSHAVQIFATDIDEEALAAARQGRYSGEIARSVSPQRLERFFARVGDLYEVRKELREICIFSSHNLIKDPPFSGLDLISCRNLLIYLEADLQQKLVPLFHYALRPGGYLLLGPSEGLAAHPELFAAVDGKSRLFQRKEDVARPAVEFPLSGRGAALLPPRTPRRELSSPVRQQTAGQAFERMILEEYAPPCAAVNERGDILYVAGRTGPYLQPPAGAFSDNLIALVPGHLKVELRAALHKAVRTRKRVVRDNVAVEAGGSLRQLRLTVRPMPGTTQEPSLYAVVWQETGAPQSLDAEEAEGPQTSLEEPVIQHLESELRTAREDLQAAVEEVESSNEELKAANEELISTNEELQSANEELRASQEELQSANQELERTVEQRRLALEAAELGTWDYRFDTGAVLWDERCRTMWGISEGSQLDYAAVVARIHPEDQAGVDEAVKRAIAGADGGAYHREFRVVWPDGSVHWVASHGRAYFEGDGENRRAVRFIGANREITQDKRAEEAQARLAAIVQSSDNAILSEDLGGIIQTWNAGARRLFGYAVEEIIGRPITALVPPERIEEEEQILRRLRSGEAIDHLETVRVAKDGRRIDVSVTISPVRDAAGRTIGASKIIHDITSRKRAQEGLRRYELLAEHSRDIILFVDRDEGRILEANAAAAAAYGYSREELLGLTIRDLRAAASHGLTDAQMAEADAHGILFETVHQRKDASTFPVEVNSRGATVGGRRTLVSVVRDITERRRAEEALRASGERYRSLFEHMLEGYAHCRMVFEDGRPRDFVYLDVNRAFYELTGLKDVVGKRVSEVIPGIRESHPELLETYGRVSSTGHPEKFALEFKPTGAWLSIAVYSTRPGHFVAVFDNIAPRKRAEEASQATIELLSLCNEARNLRELMRNLTGFLQRFTACEAVGVRLRRGDDFPYCETRGFPPEFVLAENRLCAQDQAGELVRDSAGNPVVECMCGNILCGRFDPSKPFFTKHGSFWTNSTTELLASTKEADRQARTRNRCNGEGYESVALIPIRSSGQTLGLCQFNSRQRGRFAPERIELLEQMADYVAIAIAKLQTEEALREGEERLRLALESGQMGMWEWDVGTGQSVWNAREYELLGLPAGDGRVPTSMFFQHVHPEDAPRLDRALADVLREGTSFEDEFRVIRADGELRWLAATARVFRDAGGRPLRMLGINHDITARKRAEDTARAQQMAIAHLSRVASVGEMASGLAHELNQPLGSITNYAGVSLDLLNAGADRPERMGEALRELAKEAHRASQIVRRMRSFVRKQDGRRVVEDIDTVVRESIELMRFELRRSEVRTVEELAGGLPAVTVDPVEVQQVLVNLIQNAIDAMAQTPPAQRKLLIRTSRTCAGFVSVCVVDSGCGLPSGQPEAVFTPYMTTKPDGLGLGLPISRSIVEGYGGRLVARANPDRGTTFEFTLPPA